MYIRHDMADIRVTIDGVPYGDSWKEVEGGNLEADDAKTRPGGMGMEVSAGGPATRSDLTARTQMSDVTAAWVPALEAACGNGAVNVSINWLGRNKAPLGFGPRRKGTLKSVNTPDMGGASDVGLLEIVVSCDEQAA